MTDIYVVLKDIRNKNAKARKSGLNECKICVHSASAVQRHFFDDEQKIYNAFFFAFSAHIFNFHLYNLCILSSTPMHHNSFVIYAIYI